MGRDLNLNTPLHGAVKYGHLEIVKFLTFEMNCDPTSTNIGNSTALHISAWNGHLDIVQFFISDQTCNPNIPGDIQSSTHGQVFG